jgi:hypothetical protein
MNNNNSWNRYVIWVGAILTVVSLASMILSIPDDSSIPEALLIVRNFIAFVGPIIIVGYFFVDMRNRRLGRLAKRFGLNYESLQSQNSPEEFPVNRITGRINGSEIVIEDRQKLHWLPAGGVAGGHIASRRTVFLVNQIEQKMVSSLNGYVSVGEIRQQLMNIK